MTVSLLIDPIASMFNTTGNNLAGSLEFYEAGTNTAAVTYSDSAGTIQNDNPMTLTAGRATVFGTDYTGYKIVIKDSAGAIIKTQDNVYPVANLAGLTSVIADLNLLAGAAAAGLTAAELLYLNNVTSDIQTQIDDSGILATQVFT